MVKKKEPVDDIDFDNFDDDFLNMDIDPFKDDRKPIQKVATGFLDGIKSQLTNKSFIRQTVLKAMQPGYSRAADIGDEVINNLGDLYNSAAKELQPATRMAAKATKTALPKMQGKLPKKILDKLQNFVDNQDQGKSGFGFNQDEANMQMVLGEIFQTQMEHQQDIANKSEVSNKLNTVLNFKQHKESIEELASIRQGIDKLTGYQDSINFKFQRKSLELQYKQYFVQRDTLELMRGSNKAIIESLGGILKNSALPDYVKATTGEIGHQMFKQRMLKAASGTVTQFASNYFSKFKENAAKRFQTEISPLMSMLSMGEGMGGMMDMAPGGAHGMAGSVLGSLLMDRLSDEAGFGLRGKIAKNKKIASLGNKLTFMSQNAPSLLNEWAMSGTKEGDKLAGVKIPTGILRLMKSLAPKFNMENTFESDQITSLDKPVPFDLHVRKSLVEIIPGYLSRILQSIDIMRTGDNNTELMVYDLNNNRFSTKTAVKKTLMGRMFSSTTVQGAQSSANNVLELLDKDKKLSSKARKMLQSQVLSDAANNRTITPDRYKLSESYGSFVDDKTRAELVQLFNTAGPASNEMLADLSNRSSMLRYAMPNTREIMQQSISSGYADILQEMGLTNKAGFNESLDFNKLLEIYREGAPEFNSPGKAFNNRKGKVKGKRNRPLKDTQIESIKEEMAAPKYTFGQPRYQMSYGSSTFTPFGQSTEPKQTSLVDEFKNAVLEHLNTSKLSDSDRNNKLDEIIVRLDTLPNNIAFMGPNMKGFKERTKRIGRSIKGGIGSIYNRVSSISNKILGFVPSVFGAAKNTAIGVLGKAKSFLFDKAQDVCSKAHPNIVLLRAELLKSGEYRDKLTGKVITSIDDIKGEVVDRYDNTVLSISDIQAGLVDKHGKRIKARFLKGISSLFGMANKTLGFGVNLGVQAISIPKKIFSFAKTLADELTDIYVKGEDKPRLLISKLKAGEYFNAKTGVVIRNINELKDGVKDIKGNDLLWEEEASNGLMSATGVIVLKAFKLPLKILKKAGSFAKKLLHGGIDVIGGIFGRLKEAMSFEGRQTNLLQEIRDILDKRLPDNHIDRKGSAEDILAHRKHRDGSAIDPRLNKGNKEGGGIFGNILSVLTGGFNFLKGGVGKIVGVLGGIAGGLAKVIPGLGKLGRGAWAVAKGAYKVGKAVLNNPLTKGLGRFALGAGRFALQTAGRAALAGLEFLSAPVVLTALAIGAVAYGGYKLYQYLHKKGNYLVKIRMAQYGVDLDNSDHIETMSKLEQLWQKNIQLGSGTCSLKMDKELLFQSLELFKIDKEDESKVRVWAHWFDHRFKVVYCTHAMAMNKIVPHTSLTESDDKVPLESKLEFIRLTTFGNDKDSPYNVAANPFDMGAPLATGDGEIKKITDEATKYYKEQLDKKGGKQKASEPFFKNGIAKTLFSLTIPGMIANGVDKLSGLAKKAFDWLTGTTLGGAAVTAAKTMFSLTLPGAVIGAAAKAYQIYFNEKEGVDAFRAVRLKAYGLEEFNKVDRIKTLLTLEATIADKITYDNNNNAKFTGNLQDIVENVGPRFGVNKDDEESVKRFNRWFINRFLAVYLAYCTAVKNTVANIPVSQVDDKLKPSQKAAIARAIAGAKTGMNGEISIWSISDSPFSADEKSNTNSGSCEAHIKYLESQTSQDELKTQQKVLSNKETGQMNKGSLVSGLLDRARNKVSDWMTSASDAASAAKDYASKQYQSITSGAKDIMVNAGSAARGAIAGAGNIASGALDYATAAAGKAYKAVIGDPLKNLKIIVQEMTSSKITNPQEQALMLAQLDHESGGFKHLSENLTYSPDRLMQVFPKKFSSIQDATNVVAGGPAAIAERIYGGRMGNTNPGDGFTYRGRGFIQLTGKDNYEHYSKLTGLDLVNNPDLAAEPLNAAKIAIAYWKERVAGKGANMDVQKSTYAINGGFNGLQDRVKLYGQYSAGIQSGELFKNIDINAPANDGTIANNSTAAPPPMLAKAPPPPAMTSMANTNIFDASKLNGTPASDNVAAATNATNQTATAGLDKVNYQANAQQNYQDIATTVQRKAADQYLNGGIDKTNEILSDSLDVQRSIDTNIKSLVDLLKSGQMQIPGQGNSSMTPVSTSPSAEPRSTEDVQAPISLRRVNV